MTRPGKKPPAPAYPNRIGWIRDERHMTQAQLAEAVGLPRNRMSWIESGQVLPSPADLAAMCDALKIRPRALYSAEQVKAIAAGVNTAA